MSESSVNRQLARLAPGTALRNGLDRIVNGRTGALIVLGTNAELLALSTGGFALDVAYSPPALRELAKMDGAIIVNDDLSRVLSASVHLMPAATVVTTETGTRHRTAERVARQTGLPVVTVSASMGTISLFYDGRSIPVQRPEALLGRANQALQALTGYRERLSDSLARLSALEVQDQVTLRDLALVAQRFEMTSRLADEVAGYVGELGRDGRLVSLQLRDLTADLAGIATGVQRDYATGDTGMHVMSLLAGLHDDDLFDVVMVARALGRGSTVHLDSPLRARGYRQLASIPRLPAPVANGLVERFGSLPAMFGAGAADLSTIEGVGPDLARQIRDGLVHIAEQGYDR